ncbi:MAG: ABC transporter ATP-binding protein [Erysipelotrichia bacterium]|nr:ABC transporter ATP-binding protein [Erysipelotrichia bacterium]
MLRLTKYLKKFWFALICVIALLYGQAQCELALPDYMSDIVSIGVQSSGIENSVPQLVSKETYEHLQIFMNDEERNTLATHYRFVNNVANKDELPYEISDKTLKKGVYVIKEQASLTNQTLKEAMVEPLMLVSGINASINGKSNAVISKDDDSFSEMMENIPAGMDIFSAMSLMPQNNIDKMRTNVHKQMSVLGESSVDLAGASMVKVEYDTLGVDTSAIQINYIWRIGLQMLSISFAGVLCAIIVGYFSSRIAAGVSRSLRKDTFNKVESFSNSEFNKFSTASLITRTTNDIQQIQMALTMMLRFMIYSPIMGIGAIIRVLDSDGSMIWIIAATVILIMIIISTLMAVVGPKFKAMQKLVDRLNLVMREQLSGMLVIRAFHNEEEESKKFEIANQDMSKTQVFTWRSMSLMMPTIMFIMNCVSLLIIWVGSHQVDLGTMQVGDMMAYMQYAMQIIMSFMFIAMIAIFIPRASESARRVFEVMDTPLSICDPSVSKQPLQKGTVRFNNVSFAYPNAEEEVLKGIDFVANPGETTAFIGSTGSGKSTIINLVPRFFDVSSGSVEVDGVDVREMSQHDLRDKIGLVPQKGQLFAGTIASNIKYSDETMSDEQMKEAARIAQASEFIESKPEGYDTEIAQGGGNVSGGQKQRISIARAIAKQPEIFIFDDSFSALDFKTDAKLREALNELCAKTRSTMLIVVQRVSSIMHADQIVVLEEGRMVGKGTHKELMKNCPVYQEIAYSQLSKEELENE